MRWHHDAAYLLTQPASVVGFRVASEDATLDNGCLWLQLGGHRGPLREIFEVDPASRWLEKNWLQRPRLKPFYV